MDFGTLVAPMGPRLARALATTLFIFVLSCSVFAGAQMIVSADSVGLTNIPGAADMNTQLLRRLVSPPAYGGASNFTGTITFTAGTTYYFNDVIPFKEGITLNLQNATLYFNKNAAAADQGSGFIFAVRDFTIENGTVIVDYDGSNVPGAGNAMKFGQRYADGGIYFPNSLESLMRIPMGDITVSNMLIISNNPNGQCGIALRGGLAHVKMTNVTIEGQNQLLCGIYYEFGQATAPYTPPSYTTPPPYTSHAYDMNFTGITVRGLDPTKSSFGIGITGAYNVNLSAVKIDGAHNGFKGSAGEAAFYLTWPPDPSPLWPAVPQAPGRWISLHDISMSNITGHGLVLDGVTIFRSPKCTGPNHSCGYLGNYVEKPTPQDQTDLLSYRIGQSTALGAIPYANGYGVYTNAGKVVIENSDFEHFKRGIMATADLSSILLLNSQFIDNLGPSVDLYSGSGVWSEPRQKTGAIESCTITQPTVNGISAPAIALSYATDFEISDNWLNYSQAKSKSQAIYLGPNVKRLLEGSNALTAPSNEH